LVLVLLSLASSTTTPPSAERNDRQLANILDRAPHLVNSGSELNELFDWLNQRCSGCHDLTGAKVMLAKEILILQSAQEKKWEQEYENEQRIKDIQEQEGAHFREVRARERAERLLQHKEHIFRQEEEAAKARWHKEQEILWQKGEQQKIDTHEQNERKVQQKLEARTRAVRKEKALLKRSLYTKEQRLQWQDHEEKSQAQKLAKEEQAAEEAAISLAATRRMKAAEKRLRLAAAEEVAVAEAKRQQFLAKFWPTFRPIVGAFLVQFQTDAVIDNVMAGGALGSPLMDTEMMTNAVWAPAADSR
jgi:hypothetical protein